MNNDPNETDYRVRVTWVHAADHGRAAMLGLDETVTIRAASAAEAAEAAEHDAIDWATEIDGALYVPVGEVVEAAEEDRP